MWTYRQYPFGALLCATRVLPVPSPGCDNPNLPVRQQQSRIRNRTPLPPCYMGSGGRLRVALRQSVHPTSFSKPPGSMAPANTSPPKASTSAGSKDVYNDLTVFRKSQSLPEWRIPASEKAGNQRLSGAMPRWAVGIPLSLREPVEVLSEASERFRRGRQVFRKLFDHGPKLADVRDLRIGVNV